MSVPNNPESPLGVKIGFAVLVIIAIIGYAKYDVPKKGEEAEQAAKVETVTLVKNDITIMEAAADSTTKCLAEVKANNKTCSNWSSTMKTIITAGNMINNKDVKKRVDASSVDDQMKYHLNEQIFKKNASSIITILDKK